MIQHGITQGEILRVVMGLLSVLFLIFILSWVIKKLQKVQSGASQGFQSVACMILGTKEKIMLVKVSSRYLLIGVSSGHITLLYDFGEDLPPGFDSKNHKRSFAEILQSVVMKT